MKIAVLGGCGFVGSHVVDALVLADQEVLVYDDLSSCWLTADGESPRFRNGRAAEVPEEELLDVGPEVVVDARLRHPLGRELVLFQEALDRARSGADLVIRGAGRGGLRRFVVVSSLEIVAERGPLGAHLRAYREALSYLHRPPHLDVSMVHLPELYGPRQLPEAGDVAAAISGAALTDAPAFSNLGYVGDAAAAVAARALDPRHRKSPDVYVTAPPVDVESLSRVLQDLGAADAAERILDLRRPGVSYGGGFDEVLARTVLADGLARTLEFYDWVAADEEVSADGGLRDE